MWKKIFLETPDIFSGRWRPSQLKILNPSVGVPVLLGFEHKWTIKFCLWNKAYVGVTILLASIFLNMSPGKELINHANHFDMSFIWCTPPCKRQFLESKMLEKYTLL